MRARLFALPVIAIALAAVDVSYVRAQQWHRAVTGELWWQTIILWSAFTVLALVPTALLSRWRKRRTGRAPDWLSEASLLLLFTALPVLAHHLLDRHTALGQDLRRLLTLRPWVEVGLWALALILGLRLGARLLKGRSALVAATCLLLPTLLLGAFYPPQPARLAPIADRSATNAAREKRPNLIMMIWDTTRSRSLSAYGYDEETTPNLAALTKDALLFEEARSVANYTLTSHLSMLTGTYPSHHGSRMLRMRFDARKTPSIARILRDEGYRTGAFVGTGVLRAASGIIDGFEVYDDLVDPPVCDTAAWALVHDLQAVAAKFAPQYFNHDGAVHWFQNFQRPASEVLANAKEWIEEDDPRPFFCMINMYDVHWPYLPSEEAREKFVAPYDGTMTGHLFHADDYQDRDNGGVDGSLLEDEDRRFLTELYEAELWELDREVDAFLGSIEASVGLDRIGIVLTSDHGEAFGEGGRYQHADVLEPQVRIPMIVKPPAAQAEAAGVGRRLPGKVAGIDVAPTILGMAGLVPPLADGAAGLTGAMHGRDLSRGVVELDRTVLVEDRDHPEPDILRYVFYRGHWKYVRQGIGEGATHHLYDLRTDQDGLQDVASEHPELTQELAEAMAAMRAAWNPNDEADATEGLEESNLEALVNLGYVGGEDDEEEN